MHALLALLMSLPVSNPAAVEGGSVAPHSIESALPFAVSDASKLRELDAKSILLTPTEFRLTPAQQVLGHVVAVNATVLDFNGQPLPDAAVLFQCPPQSGPGDVEWTALPPARRYTDAMGRVVLEAAITQIGRSGAQPPNGCNVSVGAAENGVAIFGQRIVVFEASFD